MQKLVNFRAPILLLILCGGLHPRAWAFEAKPGEYVVTFEAAPDQATVSDFKNQGYDFSSLNARTGLIRKKSGTSFSVMSAPGQASSSVKIKKIEPNYVYHVYGGSKPPAAADSRRDRSAFGTVFPNDPSFAKLWGLSNAKQKDSSAQKGDGRADTWAPQAWSLFKGSHSVVVAVIDTGVDYTHPDLKDNMWHEGGLIGFNAITGSNNPMDDNSHGTHCAGTIGASGSNSQGVTGVNWQVQIMPVKFMDAAGSGTLSDAIKGIRWAVDHGAQILSNSWGGGPYSTALLEAIDYARSKNVLFVAAAGNDSSNNDSSPSYPASYGLDNIISVAATDNQDKIAKFSNFGVKSVHLGAPGVGIYSTAPSSAYQFLSGTSMAAPHVAGAAALLKGFKPSMGYAELRAAILGSVEKVPALQGKTVTGGRLNLYDMLNAKAKGN